MLHNNELIDQLKAFLKEEGAFVLASQEDADYYRESHKKMLQSFVPKELPKQPPPPKPTPLQVEAPVTRVVQTPVLEPKPVAAPPTPKLTKPKAIDFSLLRNILSIATPELKIIDEIPSDDTAKKIADRWKTKNKCAPISIIVYQEPPEQRALLEKIALAIDIYFAPAKIVVADEIEKGNLWDAFLSSTELKLIITCDYTLWQLNNLMKVYKETPASGSRILGQTPVFLLPDLSLYLKDPLLKRSLWKALCQKLS